MGNGQRAVTLAQCRKGLYLSSIGPEMEASVFAQGIGAFLCAGRVATEET